MQAEIDDLIERLIKKEYESSHGGKSYMTNVLSRYTPNEINAVRQVVSEWLQDHYQNQAVNYAVMEAKINAYEEMIKKSTFAPFVETKPSEGE